MSRIVELLIVSTITQPYLSTWTLGISTLTFALPLVWSHESEKETCFLQPSDLLHIVSRSQKGWSTLITRVWYTGTWLQGIV